MRKTAVFIGLCLVFLMQGALIYYPEKPVYRYADSYYNYTGGLSAVLDLRPVIYRANKTMLGLDYDQPFRIGLFAEDVAKRNKLAGVYNYRQPYNYDDRAVIAMLVSAVQEQQEEIKMLRNTICDIRPNEPICSMKLSNVSNQDYMDGFLRKQMITFYEYDDGIGEL